jgi:hypothetical protein
MEKEFIPYELALALKELGFNEPCFGWFRSTLIPSNFTEYFLETEFGMNESPSDWVNSNFLDKACSAPLYQQALRWFREKYKMDSVIIRSFSMTNSYHYNIVIDQDYGNDLQSTSIPNRTYQQAELECLKKLIKIIKNK